jgi:hypothetical protein
MSSKFRENMCSISATCAAFIRTLPAQFHADGQRCIVAAAVAGRQADRTLVHAPIQPRAQPHRDGLFSANMRPERLRRL